MADDSNAIENTFTTQHPAFKPVLRGIIGSALANHGSMPNKYTYSNIVTDFATYVYLLGGKQCYETISANIQLPAASTVCKYEAEH